MRGLVVPVLVMGLVVPVLVQGMATPVWAELTMVRKQRHPR